MPRAIDLRAQGGFHLVRGQFGHHRVGQGTGSMHDADQRPHSGNARQHTGEFFSVGDIARLDHDVRAEVDQLVAQFTGAGRLDPAPAGQHQASHAVLGDEMSRGQPADHACSADHQDGPVQVPLLLNRCDDLDQAGDNDFAGPHRDLGLPCSQNPVKEITREFVLGFDVNQYEPARVFRLGGPDKPSDGRACQVPAPRDQDQPCGPVVGQPLLDEAQHLDDGFPDPVRHITVDAADVVQNGLGHVVLGSCLDATPIHPEQPIPVIVFLIVAGRAERE